MTFRDYGACARCGIRLGKRGASTCHDCRTADPEFCRMLTPTRKDATA